MDIIQTKRLVLRQWKESDLEPFADMNADPRVREFFPGLLTREQSDQSVQLFSDHINKHGWGFMAASLIDTGEFIGLIGMQYVPYLVAPFNEDGTSVEIGWRLAVPHWGKGYATEGALACLDYGFETLNLKEIVSFTYIKNLKSQEVMKRIGMSRKVEDDFQHPKLPLDHPLSHHVLYRKHK